MDPIVSLHSQDYKRIYARHVRAGTHFIDDCFPATNESLWHNRPLNFPVEWKRCKELSSHPHLFTPQNGLLENEVIQGAVGNCWLVSALSVLRTHPKLLNKVIPSWSKQEWPNSNRIIPFSLIHEDDEPDALGRLDIREREPHPGVFCFRFYRFGSWIEVVVDDYLPVHKQRRRPGSINPLPPPQLVYAHSQNPNEFWCSLLEKAYAKLCGSYESLETGSASDALVDLTGTVPRTIELRSEIFSHELRALEEDSRSKKTNRSQSCRTEEDGNDKLFFNMLKSARKHNSLMSCSIADYTTENGSETIELDNGLITDHAYGITDLRRIRSPWYRIADREDILLIRLHNPWGQAEWNGAWSDNSPEWSSVSERKKRQLGVRVANDGDFWMAFSDWRQQFDTLVLCRSLDTSRKLLLSAFARRRWHTAAFFGDWVQLQGTAGGCINFPDFPLNHQYAFTLRRNTLCVISLMQRDSRRDRHLGAKNLTIGFVVLKVEENRRYRITHSTYDVVGCVTYIDAREISDHFRLRPGRYICVPTTYNPKEEGQFFIRFFFSSKITVKVHELTRYGPRNPWFWKVPSALSTRWKYYFDGYVRIGIVSAEFWDPSLEGRAVGPWRYCEGSRSTLNVQSGQRAGFGNGPRSSISESLNDVIIEGFQCYATVVFTNLRSGRWGREYRTRTERNTINPQFDHELVHYIRKPRRTGVVIQIWERRQIFEDRLMGELRIALEKYTMPRRVGRTWEINRNLSRVKLVTIGNSETTAATNTPREPRPESYARPARPTPPVASQSRLSSSMPVPQPRACRSPTSDNPRAKVPRTNAAGQQSARRREPSSGRREPGRIGGKLKKAEKVDAGTGRLMIRITYFKGQMGDSWGQEARDEEEE